MTLTHLFRRAVTSFSNALPAETEMALAESVLNREEFTLWCTMDGRDMRHSIAVLRRFDKMAPGATAAERAAALLHDVGKTQSGLGWCARVFATVVGPRGRRFAAYHAHESIGAGMLRGISDPRTVELVAGAADDSISRALAAADET